MQDSALLLTEQVLKVLYHGVNVEIRNAAARTQLTRKSLSGCLPASITGMFRSAATSLFRLRNAHPRTADGQLTPAHSM